MEGLLPLPRFQRVRFIAASRNPLGVLLRVARRRKLLCRKKAGAKVGPRDP
jgi:hypothetical protein